MEYILLGYISLGGIIYIIHITITCNNNRIVCITEILKQPKKTMTNSNKLFYAWQDTVTCKIRWKKIFNEMGKY